MFFAFGKDGDKLWSQRVLCRHQLNLVVLCQKPFFAVGRSKGLFRVESLKNKISSFRGPQNYSNLGGFSVSFHGFLIFQPKIGGRWTPPTFDLGCIFWKSGLVKPQTTNKFETLQTKSSKVGEDWLMSWWLLAGVIFFWQLIGKYMFPPRKPQMKDVSSGVLAFFKGAYDKISQTLGWRLDIFDVLFWP